MPDGALVVGEPLRVQSAVKIDQKAPEHRPGRLVSPKKVST